MHHHAFVIEAEAEAGIATALAWIAKELSMTAEGNPDVIVLQHGLLTVDDARKIGEIASQGAFRGDARAIVIAANRAYHEAQNALLKVFEEPPEGTHLFLVIPALGGLLPTMRSRVVELSVGTKYRDLRSPYIPDIAQEFLKASKDKRSTLIKKLTSGKDEESRRANRDEAIVLVNGIEAATYTRVGSFASNSTNRALLEDIAVLRGHLYDRSAPVKQILEHLAIVTPKNPPTGRQV